MCLGVYGFSAVGVKLRPCTVLIRKLNKAADNFRSAVEIKVVSPSFYWSMNMFYEDLAKTTGKENDFGQDSQNPESLQNL